jgi:competence protein ComEC
MKRLRTLFVLLFALTVAASSARAEMKVHVINVGQAESILLQFENDLVLVDAGSEESDTDDYRAALLAYLNDFFERNARYRGPDGRGRIHSVIVSHPHIDHTRNLSDVLDVTKFRVQNLVYGGGRGGSGAGQLRDAKNYARAHGIARRVVNAEFIWQGGYQPQWLASLKGSSGADLRFLSGYRGGECEDANNDSLTLRVEHKGVKLLFTGDAETEDKWCAPQVSYLLNNFDAALLDVDVYKVGHHASDNGTSRALMDEMTPRVALISAGDYRTRTADPQTRNYHAWFYGHPREDAVARIERRTGLSRRTPADVYTMNGVASRRANRRVEKAVYCTCWDGHVLLEISDAGALRVNGVDL